MFGSGQATQLNGSTLYALPAAFRKLSPSLSKSGVIATVSRGQEAQICSMGLPEYGSYTSTNLSLTKGAPSVDSLIGFLQTQVSVELAYVELGPHEMQCLPSRDTTVPES
mmetsp:Transcript_49929/g.150167  ORF Transcript_49929/g.150167 Transcript_49929/m.150167 type:complete len:110 (+) Transcript_49929:583-912(+)